MAPTRKSRSVNKQFSSSHNLSPEKDGVNSHKNKQRKKKLSDKLGSQWSKEELERFYEAYRKYGKDWKKVAAVVRNRSIDMVEALYNMNRAYLSLPEGTASVVGLVAMMTDHYNVLDGSDSERESNEAPESRKPVKRKREKVQHSVSKDPVVSQSIASSDGCLSLLKKRRLDGIQPRAVGKRTPRVPVYHSHKKDDGENYDSPNKRSLKSTIDANDDEVAHVVALALTEAAQRGGSPQVSRTPHRRAEQKPSPVQSRERMHKTSEAARAKFRDAYEDEEFFEDSIESRGAENGEYARDTSYMKDMEGIGTVEVFKKGGKVYRKKERVEKVGNHELDDGGEACSGTVEGLSFSSLKEKVEVTNGKLKQSSLKIEKKRNKKLFSGDEATALNALQTLADLSLMMPTSTVESESSVLLKGERMTVDKDDRSTLPEATSTSHKRYKNKLSEVPRVEISTSKKPKLGKELADDINARSESKEQPPSTDRTWKRKRKSIVSKVANTKLDSYLSDSLNNEAVNDDNKPVIKGKQTDHVFTPTKQLKAVRLSESSLRNDHKDGTVSTTEAVLSSEISLPTKRSRRKTISKRIPMPKEKSSENILKTQPNNYSTQGQGEKLSSCLSSYMVRRWITFEWFYSAIDYPWFAKREFMEYLNHVGLGNIPRLTRIEWSVIKSSLGKPRRFSEHFLREEKQKLVQYRESVRKHYTEVRTGIRDGLPTDLARPLCVGQRVIALHPKTREIHDGSVLTVDHDKCRIQFDRPELGVEFVMDIDCMPSNLLDNMPEALRRQIGVQKATLMTKEPLNNGNSSFGGCVMRASPVKGDVNHVVAQAKIATTDALCIQAACAQPCKVTHHQAKEADVHALAELQRALDKKETLLMELRNANSDILENQNGIECLKDSEAFKKHYATVLVELKEASGQVSDAMHQLRQRNTYTGNSLPSWIMPQANFIVHDGLPCMLDSSLAQELGSTASEIIKGSRLKAQAMVDAAFQASSLTKEGEDAFRRIEQALDSIDYQQLAPKSRLPVIRSQGQVNGSLNHHNGSTGCASERLANDASGPKLHNDSESDKIDAEIRKELITSCVASLMMIQTCTERQYPPADVAQILDSAVTSLYPCSRGNLPIYREIQMCMGRIKTQILALVPT